MHLILASTSPYRRQLLERLGLPFDCVAPPVDEEAIKSTLVDIPPQQVAERLAFEKARSVALLHPESTVIGGDQLVHFEGQILGKPGNVDRAVAQLLAMSGRTHELITAIVVIHQGRAQAHTEIARLQLRPIDEIQARRYVEADHPTDCAGSYKLESRGITLFDRIDTSDHSAIVGMPLIALTTILRSIGYEVP